MKDINLLGLKVRDTVTGFTGVVTTISYDLYGCVQAIVTPSVDSKTQRREDGQWFDTKRLVVLAKTPVMDQPSFQKVAGGDHKSLPPSSPR